MKQILFTFLILPLMIFSPFQSLQGYSYLFDEFPPRYFPPSIHLISKIAILGDSLEIEDGSIWKICFADKGKVLHWRSCDPITITQNHRWFSNYSYRIINENTGEFLEANLFLGPHEEGLNTLYATKINKHNGELATANRSGEFMLWEIFDEDRESFLQWSLNDAIVIGQNSGWEADWEALLINVQLNQSIRARQIE